MIRRLAVSCAVLFLFAMAGCRHRQPKAIAVILPPPEIHPVMVSVPPPTHPSEPLPLPEKPIVVEVTPLPTPSKKIRKKRTVSVAPVATPAPTQVAVAEPAISLGQLSAGGDSGTALRSETEQMIATQKQRLEKLPSPLVSSHATETDQVRRFLKGSETAWRTGDVEGAHTLALKAKILLDDLLH